MTPIVTAQLASDRAAVEPDWCEPYVEGDSVRVLICGHEFWRVVSRLIVGRVDSEPQVLVVTFGGLIWQQSYLGGWLVSWGGGRKQYEPLPGGSRILGRAKRPIG